MRLRTAIEVVTLDGARKTATLRASNHVNHLAVRELIDEHFVADVRVVAAVEQAEFFQYARRRNAPAGLLEMTAHGLGDVLQLQRPLVPQPELPRIVTVRSGR